MKIVYGTTNISKIELMKSILKEFDIEIIGKSEILTRIPNIEETGNNPLDNALIKAKKYYDAIQLPVFSCDTGLFIDELDADAQPGTHVRNIYGRRLSDEEMICYYADIARRCGGTCTAYYQNAICCVTAKGIYKKMDSSIAGKKFILTSVPHEKRLEGFPLDSISVDQHTDEYFVNIPNRDILDVSEGYCDFFEMLLKNR